MKVSILIVDDESEIVTMLARHFRYLQYEVATASNGEEALEVLEQHKTDIVISDIMMPVLDGVELLKQVRKHHPMVRTIMITGYVTLDNALACMRYGAESFIFKPLTDLSELEQAVASASEKIQYWADIFKELKGMKTE